MKCKDFNLSLCHPCRRNEFVGECFVSQYYLFINGDIKNNTIEEYLIQVSLYDQPWIQYQSLYFLKALELIDKNLLKKFERIMLLK